MTTDSLTANFDRLHTTALGVERIRKNLCLPYVDVVEHCKQMISVSDNIFKKGKNWYIYAANSEIVVNATSFTIITAHKINPTGH